MAPKFSNEVVLEQLKNRFAQFELVSSPVLSISTSISQANFPASLGDYIHRLTGPLLGGGSIVLGKAEIYSAQEVKRDGRCLFRALVKGMRANKGYPDLSERQEKIHAGELREKVKEVICENEREPHEY